MTVLYCWFCIFNLFILFCIGILLSVVFFFFAKQSINCKACKKKDKCYNNSCRVHSGLGITVIIRTVCRKYDNNKIVAFVIMLWKAAPGMVGSYLIDDKGV